MSTVRVRMRAPIPSPAGLPASRPGGMMGPGGRVLLFGQEYDLEVDKTGFAFWLVHDRHATVVDGTTIPHPDSPQFHRQQRPVDTYPEPVR